MSKIVNELLAAALIFVGGFLLCLFLVKNTQPTELTPAEPIVIETITTEHHFELETHIVATVLHDTVKVSTEAEITATDVDTVASASIPVDHEKFSGTIHVKYSYLKRMFDTRIDLAVKSDSVTVTKNIINKPRLLSFVASAGVYKQQDTFVFRIAPAVRIREKLDIGIGLNTNGAWGLECGYKFK
jgi:hypothetical protein